jgi:hypothetical protein
MNLRLAQEVIIAGPNYFGFPSRLRLTPYSGMGTDWCWRTDRFLVPITPLIANTRMRRVQLAHQDATFEIYEHLGCLQYTGLKSVAVTLEKGWPRGFPPYHGRAWEVWEKVYPHCISLDQPLPRYTVGREVHWDYPRNRRSQHSFIHLEPNNTGRLIVNIRVKYPGYGEKEKTFNLPDMNLLETAFKARTQGWPPAWKPFSRLGSLLGLWRNHPLIRWPRGKNDPSLLDDFILHRLQDILGTLSMLCRDGLFGATVTSRYAGHEADLAAAQEAGLLLRRVHIRRASAA